jgi:hypothetical protein
MFRLRRGGRSTEQQRFASTIEARRHDANQELGEVARWEGAPWRHPLEERPGCDHKSKRPIPRDVPLASPATPTAFSLVGATSTIA